MKLLNYKWRTLARHEYISTIYLTYLLFNIFILNLNTLIILLIFPLINYLIIYPTRHGIVQETTCLLYYVVCFITHNVNVSEFYVLSILNTFNNHITKYY